MLTCSCLSMLGTTDAWLHRQHSDPVQFLDVFPSHSLHGAWRKEPLAGLKGVITVSLRGLADILIMSLHASCVGSRKSGRISSCVKRLEEKLPEP